MEGLNPNSARPPLANSMIRWFIALLSLSLLLPVPPIPPPLTARNNLLMTLSFGGVLESLLAADAAEDPGGTHI